jgi:hypothetical protein
LSTKRLAAKASTLSNTTEEKKLVRKRISNVCLIQHWRDFFFSCKPLAIMLLLPLWA